MDLDLSGIGELLLDLLCDVAGQQSHLILADLLGLDHDADLAACLNCVASGDTGEALGNLFELFKTLDVVFDVLAACTGAGSGDRVGGLHDAGNDCSRLNVAVVGFDSMDDVIAFLVLLCDINADGDVAALDLVVDGLADIARTGNVNDLIQSEGDILVLNCNF